jgi:hypothetical protein
MDKESWKWRWKYMPEEMFAALFFTALLALCLFLLGVEIYWAIEGVWLR